jgi:hypothetical protein
LLLFSLASSLAFVSETGAVFSESLFESEFDSVFECEEFSEEEFSEVESVELELYELEEFSELEFVELVSAEFELSEMLELLSKVACSLF